MKKLVILPIIFFLSTLSNAFPNAGTEGGSTVGGDSKLNTTTVTTDTNITVSDNAEANIQVGNQDLEGMAVGGDLESTSTTVSQDLNVNASGDSKANVKIGGVGK